MSGNRVERIDASVVASPPPAGEFRLGTAHGPGRPRITVSSTCLYRDGVPWLGVMGEIHYARVPADDWHRSLSKMKAGGLDVVASYVFWIHHEEVEGTFDFSGDRDLRRFVQACADVALPVIIRLGPWCHGEVRNGGLPDWILAKPFKARTDDPGYVAYARRLYARIADELRGLLWKDGGPVLGVQVENEYGGPGEHLLTLRRLACEVGLDVPLYIRTGWPSPATPLPFGELLPLYGAYAEGFWARELTPMPGHHWKAFVFETVRTDIEVGMDQLGDRPPGDEIDTPQYPYLTCEIGGGMEQSYHRRVLIDPRDTLAVVVTKIGSGSNLPGYYMYHGGTNPAGKLTTLQESQATAYWNDVATLSYDFQAPLGQFGQVREPYALLRRLHLFLQDFGPALAPMRPVLPKAVVTGKDDTTTLRWSLRAAGDAGFVFVSNYQRLSPMPAKPAVALEVTLPSGRTVSFPPVTIPADSTFIWPVGLKLAAATLQYATAQVICRLSHAHGTPETLVLAETPGLPTELAFEVDPATEVLAPGCDISRDNTTLTVRAIEPSMSIAVTLRAPDGAVTNILLLDHPTSLRLTKLTLSGRERLILAPGPVWVDEGNLHLEVQGPAAVDLAVYPPLDTLLCRGTSIPAEPLGAFAHFTLRPRGPIPQPLAVTPIQSPGPLRNITLGSQHVAEAPTDPDFAHAAIYSITLPPDLHATDLIRLTYIGDVARAYADGHLLTDQFYNGRVFDVRVPVGTKTLQVRILPFQKSAPIHLHPDIRRDIRRALPEGEAVVTLTAAELLHSELFEFQPA